MTDLRLRRWVEGDYDPDATAAGHPAARVKGGGEPTGGFAERFVYQKEIGRGGMGSVHRAVDRKLLRQLAVKMLEAESGDLETATDRFHHEAQISSQLDHPNIVPIYDLDADADGTPFLLMKLVRGDSLATVLTEAGTERLRPTRLKELLRILTKVCEAVSFAHSRGVVHRDIKPANIMVGPFGEVYLMDWGIALLLPEAGQRPVPDSRTADRRTPDREAAERVRTGVHCRERGDRIIGSLHYLAPEQIWPRRPIDERTDVFLLGATLYHILAGRPPYRGGSTQKLLRRAAAAEFPAPEEVAGDAVPRRLSRIVRQAMAADPADRPASVQELQQQLEDFLSGSWHLPTETFRRGERIIGEGEVGDTAYILVEGHCAVFKGTGDDRMLIREMGPGEAFGETAVVSDKPRTASVEALDDVTVMTVTREAMAEGLGLNSWVGSFVVALAERFREVDARLWELERQRARSEKGAIG